MADLTGFNAAEVEPNTGFDPIPAGDYVASISGSEMKENSKKNGHYLKLEFIILEGEYENRKLWVNLNLDNPNPKAVQIAKAELSAICRAVDVMTPKDSSDLHDLPLVIKVGLEKREDTGDIQNRIKKYMSKVEAAKTAAGAKPTTNGAAGGAPKPAAGAGSAPWARK